MDKKNKYYLCSSTKRFFSRAFDFLLSFIIIFLFSLIIFQDYYFNKKNIELLINNNRILFLFFSTTSFCILFIYFILIPYFFNGRTIFKFLFRIRVIFLDKKKKKFFYYLVKKEFFIWGFISIFNIIITIIDLTILKDKSFIQQVYFSDIYDKLAIYVILFRAINSSLLVLFLFVNLNLFIKSKKRTSLDYISKTAVVYNNYITKQVNTNKKDISKMYNKLPGIIDLNEIDILIDNKKERSKNEAIPE